MFLYQLTFASGKVYIGQTRKTVEQRLRTHAKDAKRGSPLPVHAAWRKHGEPVCVTLGQFATAELLNEAEIAAIANAECRVPAGYNLAGGGANRIVHDSTRAKIAAYERTAEARAAMSAAAKARVRKPWSAETRAKMSESGKRAHAREASGERGRAISKALRNRFENMTPEQRQAFSEVRKRAWETRRCKQQEN